MALPLTDLAARALPPYLREAWEMTRDAEYVAEEAESFVNVTRLVGRVGPTPSSKLVARRMGDDWLRIDCGNNLEFWMEINVDTLEVRGRAPSSMHIGYRDPTGSGESLWRGFDPRKPEHAWGLLRGQFVAQRYTTTKPIAGLDTIRVTHTSCPAFFVELAM